MSVRPDATALDAPAADEETALGAAIRESAQAVISARGSSELGLSELLATVLATLVNDVPGEDVESLKTMAPAICENVFAGATACVHEGEFESVEGERISMKLPIEAGEKLNTACEAAETLPVIPSVVDEVMSAAEAVVTEKAVETTAVVEAPTPDAVEVQTDAAVAVAETTDGFMTDAAVEPVAPADSASEVASAASTTIDAKLDTLLDCIALSHEKIHARLDSLSEVLLKTTGTPMSDKFDRETIMFFQSMYAPNKERDAKQTISTHTGLDMAALIQNARVRHGL